MWSCARKCYGVEIKFLTIILIFCFKTLVVDLTKMNWPKVAETFREQWCKSISQGIADQFWQVALLSIASRQTDLPYCSIEHVKQETCDQSYKCFTIAIYDSVVVITRKSPVVRPHRVVNYKIGHILAVWHQSTL